MKFFKYQILTFLFAYSWTLPIYASSIITVEHNFLLTIGNLTPTSVSNYSNLYYLPSSYNHFPIISDGHIGPGSASAQYIHNADNFCFTSSSLSFSYVSLKTQFPVSQGGFNWLIYYINIPSDNYKMNFGDNYNYHYILNGVGQYYSYTFLKIDDHFYYPWEYLNINLTGNFDSGVISKFVNLSEVLSAGPHTIQFYSGTTQEVVPLTNTIIFLISGLVILIIGKKKLYYKINPR
jgi:hypothetical protein